MIVLGIESTAHTLGVAVIRDTDILSNCKSSYTTQEGGMIPVKVAQHHEKNFKNVLSDALLAAQVRITDIDIIAYSASPGLGHALRIGAAAAKSLAIRHNIPLVPVNHAVAHLEIAGLVSDATDPVLLYVSGANTQVIAYEAGKYRVFGETLDIGIGNLLDTIARHMGYGFPGGPEIERLAQRGRNFINIPYTVKGMDVSLAGLETNMKRKISARTHRNEDLAFSLQETVFAMLIECAERAMAHLKKNELALGGGVACNGRLQEMARIMCEERGAKCFIPDKQFLVDNAAMIAWTGCLMHTKGGISARPEEASINPYERTDDVDVTWK